MQPFKSQIYAAARAVFNLNSQCGTVFSLLIKTDVCLMGQLHLICQL